MEKHILAWEFDQNRINEAIVSAAPLVENISPANAANVFHQLAEAPFRVAVQMPESGWTMFADNVIRHPAQGMLSPLARAMHMGEIIFVYPHRFFAVLQNNNSFTIARIV